MKFLDLAEFLKRLEETPKRLEMTSILSELINEIDVEEIDLALYLSLGYLKAPFATPKFNMAEKMVIRVLADTFNKDIEEITKLFKKSGDMGTTFLELSTKATSDISITELHKRLMEIAETEGTGSQEIKVSKSSKLLREVDKLSGKYIVRTILGTTRLGFTELTIIDALAQYLGNKSLNEQIEQSYNMHPDIGKVAKVIKENGLKGLHKINIIPGTPILLQRAQRVKSFDEVLERMKVTTLEYKLDGTRVQLHIDKGNTNKTKATSLFGEEKSSYLAKTFTRNLEETTDMYPDILEGAEKQLEVTSVILDGEAIGYNPKTGTFLPFQEMMQRKRKHGVSEMAKEIPLKYFVFDILYLNGKNLMEEPLTERRKYLKKIIKEGNVLHQTEHLETSNPEELYEYFDLAKEKGLEGLIAKNPEDKYQAGARSYSWIKLKVADEKLMEDSVDCVILGYYYGKGTRAKFGIGALLLGIYDPDSDQFKTISKLGTGLTESDLEQIKIICDKNKINTPAKNVIMNKMFTPDVFVNPKIVLEIGADEVTKSPSHSANYALRFPRLLKIRTDKSAVQATTLKEIEDMYKHKGTKKK